MSYFTTFDPDSPEGDYSTTQIWETPGPIRRFFRRIGWDKSTWQLRLVDSYTEEEYLERLADRSF